MILSRRAFLRTGTAGLLAAPAILRSLPARAAVEADAGQTLLLGFADKAASGASARALAGHLAAGRAGGVMFLGNNIGTRNELLGLTALFRAEGNPLIAVDQEGGRVQRLSTGQGFARMPRASAVGSQMSVA